MKNKIKKLLLIGLMITILPSFTFISSPKVYLNGSEIKDQSEIIIDNNKVLISSDLLSNIWSSDVNIDSNQISFNNYNDEYFSGPDFFLDDNFVWYGDFASYTKTPPTKIDDKIYFPIEIVEEQNKEFNLLKNYNNNSINIYYKEEENMPKTLAKYEDVNINKDLDSYFKIKRLNNYYSNSINSMSYMYDNIKIHEDINTILATLSDAAKTIEFNKYEINNLDVADKYNPEFENWKNISEDITKIIEDDFYTLFISYSSDAEKKEKLEDLINKLNEKNKELNESFKLIENKL